MGDMGAQQRAVEHQYAMAPIAQLEMLGQLYGGTPFQLFNGQTVNGTTNSNGTSVTKSSPSLFNQLLAAGQAAVTIASDVRLKKDIRRVGTLENGLGLYLYRYLWDEDDRTPRIGVMAQDVARIAPEALGAPRGGYMTVDYGKLGLAHLVAG
jgi:hypothetical protein